ncbi:hypothetical protein [Halomicrobium salinisoli]|uniref:hypothetical protein n=1 Tax=Halomicrobium salinisoli TaxID=2878391 RepID=UPI001CF0B07D|nr:hypothetical protein [Halomicrobium salinisoli]
MYVSRAVETIREDPVPGERVALVLETDDDADPDAVAAAAEGAGADVERRLQFGDLEVSVDQEAVGAVCEIDGLAAVQTADAIGIHPDEAEEDVDPDA